MNKMNIKFQSITNFPVLEIIYIRKESVNYWPNEFANVPEDRSLLPGRVIPKIQKVVFDAALLNTQHYKVGIKGKVD